MISEDTNSGCRMPPPKMKPSIQDTFLGMSQSTSTETSTQNSPYRLPYQESHMFTDDMYFTQGESSTNETTIFRCHQQIFKSSPSSSPNNTDSSWYPFSPTHHQQQQQQPLHLIANEQQHYLQQDSNYSRSKDNFTNSLIGSNINSFSAQCQNSTNANDVHYGHSIGICSELYNRFAQPIDNNNSNCRNTTDNAYDYQNFVDECIMGKDNSANWDVDFAQPIVELYNLYREQGSSDSGVSRSSSIGSSADEEVFYNACPAYLEQDHQSAQDPQNGYFYEQDFEVKADCYDGHCLQHDTVLYDNCKPLRDYGSISAESAFFPNYFPNGNITEATSCTPRQSADMQQIHSRHGSPVSDEGFFEELLISEEKLPYFSKIQQLTDSDRDSQSSRSIASVPKEKKKPVREIVPQVEKERRKPGRKPGQVSNVLHLWEFIRDLLQDENNQGVIEWISKQDGVFQVKNSSEVARLWGEKKKNKKKMTYEKLSRSLRYSRLEGYFADLPKDKNYPKKLCFRFGPKSKNWCDKRVHF